MEKTQKNNNSNEHTTTSQPTCYNLFAWNNFRCVFIPVSLSHSPVQFPSSNPMKCYLTKIVPDVSVKALFDFFSASHLEYYVFAILNGTAKIATEIEQNT